MWFVIALGFAFVVSLMPNVQKQLEQTIEGISSAITKGPTSTVVSAWEQIAVVAAGLGLGIWLLETHIAKKQGYDVAPPPVEPIRVASPPTFGSSAGYTAGPGGVAVHSGISSTTGGGSPQVTVLDAPAARPREKRSRLERKAERAGLRARIADSRAAEERAKAAARAARARAASRGRGFGKAA